MNIIDILLIFWECTDWFKSFINALQAVAAAFSI